MLARTRRLSIRALREVRWQHENKTPLFIVRWTSVVRTPSRFAVSIPLRASKSAPARHKLRRLVFNTLRVRAPLSGPDAAFFILPKALTAPPEDIELAIEEFIRRTTPHTP